MRNILLTFLLGTVATLSAQKFGFNVQVGTFGFNDLSAIETHYPNGKISKKNTRSLGVSFFSRTRLPKGWELQFQAGLFTENVVFQVDSAFWFVVIPSIAPIPPNSGFHNISKGDLRIGVDVANYSIPLWQKTKLGGGFGLRLSDHWWDIERYNYTTFAFNPLSSFSSVRYEPQKETIVPDDFAIVGWRLFAGIRIDRGENRYFELQTYLQHFRNQFRFEYAEGEISSKPEVGLAIAFCY